MAEDHSSTFSLPAFLAQLLFALFVAWVTMLSFLSYQFTDRLLHPTCAPSTPDIPGFEPITLTTEEGLRLDGWWRASQNGRVILLLGGLGSNRDSMLAEADILTRHGYGILTLDSRTCIGEISTLGAREISEFQAMRDFAIMQPGVQWIGALGYSIGGVTVLNGAASMPEIKAVVIEGNYPNLYREITASSSIPLSLQWQIQHTVVGWYGIFTGIAPWQVNPQQALPLISPRPVLLIFGEKEFERVRGREQFNAAGENSELWIVPGAGHGEYLMVAPQEYERKLIEFFDNASRNT